MTDYSTIVLKPGRDKPVRQKHPWVFSGAVAKEPGEKVPAGSVVQIVDSRGSFLAFGAYSPKSQIRARIFSWDESIPVNAELVFSRVKDAIHRRRDITKRGQTTALRLVFSESDGLPGIVIDQYETCAVLQLLTSGADKMRDIVVAAMRKELPELTAIVERSDDHGRELEGLPKVNQVLFGSVPESGRVTCLENGVKFLVDVLRGHKTGFYIDQRESREFVRSRVRGLDVLNCFCYTGGFSLASAAGGATSVLSIDSSGPALELAKENASLNGFDTKGIQWLEADVFERLRILKEEKRSFDVVILDPPKFAHNAGQLNRATRGYKDLIMNGLQITRPGGYLAAFSCSGLISDDLFQKVAFGAALDAKIEAQIIGRFMQAEDHPILLTFPESGYLKGLWLRRL